MGASPSLTTMAASIRAFASAASAIDRDQEPGCTGTADGAHGCSGLLRGQVKIVTATVLAGHLPPFFETTFGGRLWATGDQPRSAHRQIPRANGQRRETTSARSRALLQLSSASPAYNLRVEPPSTAEVGAAASNSPAAAVRNPEGPGGDGRLRRRCPRALGLHAPGQQLDAFLRSAQRGRRRARGAARVRDARLPPERLPAAGGPAPSPTSLPAPGHPRTSDARVCVF